MKTVWRAKTISKEKALDIAKKYNLSLLLSGLISERIENTNLSVESFLNPKITDQHSPFLIPNMEKAVDRILEAIENEEKILIYGDYDSDGFSATAILYRFFQDQGLDPAYYIPNRFSEGYGINKKKIKNFKELGYDLIITVDTGIVAIEEAKYAKELGIDLIITDHHEPQEELPEAIAVVNPKIGNSYPFRDIAGCCVAYKLVCAVSESLGMFEEYTQKFLPFVSIGTISDVMPLKDENRVILKLGLEQFNTSKIKAIELLRGNLKVTAEDIAFKIAPKLNASGRLGTDLGCQLLIDEDNAVEINKELEKLNKKRKDIVAEILESIKYEEISENGVVFYYADNLHEGVLGIVAAKLVEITKRPVLIATLSDHGTYKASGRAPVSYDLMQMFKDVKKNFIKFGGHQRACGCEFDKDKVLEIKKEISNIDIDKFCSDNIIYYDFPLSISNLTLPLVESLELLEPFGEENRRPLFLFKNLKILRIRKYEKVVTLYVKEQKDDLDIGSEQITVLSLNLEKFNNIKEGDKIHLLGELRVNPYNGKKSIQIFEKDVRSV